MLPVRKEFWLRLELVLLLVSHLLWACGKTDLLELKLANIPLGGLQLLARHLGKEKSSLTLFSSITGNLSLLLSKNKIKSYKLSLYNLGFTGPRLGAGELVVAKDIVTLEHNVLL